MALSSTRRTRGLKYSPFSLWLEAWGVEVTGKGWGRGGEGYPLDGLNSFVEISWGNMSLRLRWARLRDGTRVWKSGCTIEELKDRLMGRSPLCCEARFWHNKSVRASLRGPQLSFCQCCSAILILGSLRLPDNFKYAAKCFNMPGKLSLHSHLFRGICTDANYTQWLSISSASVQLMYELEERR